METSEKNKTLEMIDELGEFFYEVYPNVMRNTVVTMDRLFSIYWYLKRMMELHHEKWIGPEYCFNIAEVGVFQGGTAKVILEAANKFLTCRDINHKIMLFDTFEGLPYDNKEFDLHRAGQFKETSLEGVSRFLNDENITLHKGIFPDSANEAIKALKFDFVHLDVDLYDAYKDCLEFFYPKMKDNGVIICDDYNFPSCPGAKKAIDEFFADKEQRIITPATKQAIILF